jgi:CRISPR-associated protein Csb2
VNTTLALRFPWGRYHGTAWGRHVNEAAVDWPPSPWRVLRALYATWRTRAADLPAAVVHPLLDALAKPPEYVLPSHRLGHTRHYLPDGVRATGKGFEEGIDKVLDAFVVVERDAPLYVSWPVDVPAEQRAALGRLASLLPYLGRAESVCTAQRVDEVPVAAYEAGTRACPLESWDEGAVSLLAAASPLDFKALQERGGPAPEGTRWVPYGIVGQAVGAPRESRPPVARPTAARWTLTARARPAAIAAVAMTDVLRAACQRKYADVSAGGASSTLSGRCAEGPRRRDDHAHAHYLALDLDHDGLLDTLVVWAPEGFGENEVRALGRLDRLTGHGQVPDFRPGRLALAGLGRVGDVVPELVAGPEGATHWRTLTPFAPSRHAKRGTPWETHVAEQVRFELAARSLPPPVEVRIEPGAWLRYRRHRPTTERLDDARRAVGLTVTLADPVVGPLCLGALSHFGLGLFAPSNRAG